MKKNYVKPEILEEIKLERTLVYAKSQTPEDECTTLQGKIDQDTQFS